MPPKLSANSNRPISLPVLRVVDRHARRVVRARRRLRVVVRDVEPALRVQRQPGREVGLLRGDRPLGVQPPVVVEREHRDRVVVPLRRVQHAVRRIRQPVIEAVRFLGRRDRRRTGPLVREADVRDAFPVLRPDDPERLAVSRVGADDEPAVPHGDQVHRQAADVLAGRSRRRDRAAGHERRRRRRGDVLRTADRGPVLRPTPVSQPDPRTRSPTCPLPRRQPRTTRTTRHARSSSWPRGSLLFCPDPGTNRSRDYNTRGGPAE